MKFTVTTNEIEEKALRWAELNPQKWLEIVVKNRAQVAMKELYSIELKKALSNPETKTISSNIEEVVLASTELSLEEKQNQLMQTPLDPTILGGLTTYVVPESPRTFLEGNS